MATVLALLILAAGAPRAIDCLDAASRRDEAALRIRVFLRREVERGYLDRAELGATRALAKRRERLLACPPEREL